MRMRQFSFLAMVAWFSVVSVSEAQWFRGLHMHGLRRGSGVVVVVEAPASGSRNVDPPAAPLNISSSGLEGEVLQRIQDWADKGVTPTKTKTDTGKLPAPSGDLVKDLQKAFSNDTVPAKLDKGQSRDTLANLLLKVAATVKGPNEIKNNLEVVNTKGRLRGFVGKALLDGINPKALENTQNVVKQYLDRMLSIDDPTLLTPAIRADVATELEKIANAVMGLK